MLKQTLETPTNSSTHPFYGLSNEWNPGHRSSSIGRCLKAVVALNTLPCDLQFLFISLSFQLQARREGLSIAGRFWVGTLGYLESKNDLQVKWRWGFTQRWLNIASSSSCWCCCCCWWSWWWWWWRATKRIWRVESKMPIHHQRRASRGPNRSGPFLPRLRFFIRYFFRCLGASQAWKHSTLFCFFCLQGIPGVRRSWPSVVQELPTSGPPRGDDF